VPRSRMRVAIPPLPFPIHLHGVVVSKKADNFTFTILSARFILRNTRGKMTINGK